MDFYIIALNITSVYEYHQCTIRRTFRVKEMVNKIKKKLKNVHFYSGVRQFYVSQNKITLNYLDCFLCV